MTKYIVFDNEGRTQDRYTVVDRRSGDVFSASDQGNDAGFTGRYCGNCADHRVTLYGAGWRQMPLSRRIIEAETDNYIRNAQLNPDWLGKEITEANWPDQLRDYVGTLGIPQASGLRSIQGPSYRESHGLETSKTAMGL